MKDQIDIWFGEATVAGAVPPIWHAPGGVFGLPQSHFFPAGTVLMGVRVVPVDVGAGGKAKGTGESGEHKGVASKPTPKGGGGGPASPRVPGSRKLARGSRGADVSALQAILNEKIASVLKVDGIFGAKTAKAVRDFQRSEGLNPDAVVGRKTWAALGVGGKPAAK